MLVPGPTLNAPGVAVGYPKLGPFVPHTRSGGRAGVRAGLAPAAPRSFCPGTRPRRRRRSRPSARCLPPASRFSVSIPRAAFATSQAVFRTPPPPPRARRERERRRAPDVTRSAPAPRLFRRAPRPGPSLGRAPLPPPRRSLSVSRCPCPPRPRPASSRTRAHALARPASSSSSTPPARPPAFPFGPRGSAGSRAPRGCVTAAPQTRWTPPRKVRRRRPRPCSGARAPVGPRRSRRIPRAVCLPGGRAGGRAGERAARAGPPAGSDRKVTLCAPPAGSRGRRGLSLGWDTGVPGLRCPRRGVPGRGTSRTWGCRDVGCSRHGDVGKWGAGDHRVPEAWGCRGLDGVEDRGPGHRHPAVRGGGGRSAKSGGVSTPLPHSFFPPPCSSLFAVVL